MWSALLLCFGIASPGPALVDGAPCHPRRLLVHAEGASAQAAVARLGLTVLRHMPEIGWDVVETPKNQLQTTRRRLNGLRGVRADLDRAARPAYNPNDPMWGDMWHFRAINVDRAWDLSFGGPVTVAIIDTGVKVDHEDLAANMWTNPGEIPGNLIDDDQNGYVDDVYGYDFAHNTPDVTDDYGHGTNCAGLVAAVQDNLLGVTGMAPRAKIMALKAADGGFLYDSALVPAYLYARAMGAQVLSMSYFSDRVSQAERDALDLAVSDGIVAVAAAGNSNTVFPYYPGAYESVIGVAALDTNLLRAGFSNFGSWADVAAPGVALATPTNTGGYTTGFGGTSGATPHVAGLAALLRGTRPSATGAEIRAAIEDTAVPIVQAPFGEFCNYGRIDAEAAVRAILGPPAPPRAPVVRWVSPVSISLKYASAERYDRIVARIYGRGFQSPTPASVTVGGTPLQIVARSRDWIDVILPLYQDQMVVTVGGQEAGVIRMPIFNELQDELPVKTLFFPLVEASTQGATLEGGFHEALNRDIYALRCTRRSDGVIRVHATFRNVRLYSNQMVLKLVRRYTQASPGTERVALYDWSTGSYPYGSFVQLGTHSLTSSPTTSTYGLANPARFIDPEGTMYLRIETTDEVAEGTELLLDLAQMRNRVPG